MAIDPEAVERYQIEYQKNPKSRVFAPLAEAYRQMGLLEEAFQICTAGVGLHPEFPGGLVAMAKVLIDRGDREGALTQLKKCVSLSPDNILAHTIMGELYLQLRRPKDALKAYKTVLFLNPNDEKAQSVVRKWEFLSAEEFEDELFEMKPVFQAVTPPEIKPISDDEFTFDTHATPSKDENEPPWRNGEIERAVSLVDAFIVRGETDRAAEVLRSAEDQLGASPEFEKRLRMIERTRTVEGAPDRTQIPMTSENRAQRRQKLEAFLQRINERRFDEG